MLGQGKWGWKYQIEFWDILHMYFTFMLWFPVVHHFDSKSPNNSTDWGVTRFWESFWLFCLVLGIEPSGLAHSRQVLYHWTLLYSPALLLVFILWKDLDKLLRLVLNLESSFLASSVTKRTGLYHQGFVVVVVVKQNKNKNNETQAQNRSICTSAHCPLV